MTPISACIECPEADALLPEVCIRASPVPAATFPSIAVLRAPAANPCPASRPPRAVCCSALPGLVSGLCVSLRVARQSSNAPPFSPFPAPTFSQVLAAEQTLYELVAPDKTIKTDAEERVRQAVDVRAIAQAKSLKAHFDAFAQRLSAVQEAERQKQLEALVAAKLQAAEAAGEAGNVDEAQRLSEEAEQLKGQARSSAPQKNADPQTGGDQKLRCCDICSAFLSIYDNERRLVRAAPAPAGDGAAPRCCLRPAPAPSAVMLQVVAPWVGWRRPLHVEQRPDADALSPRLRAADTGGPLRRQGAHRLQEGERRRPSPGIHAARSPHAIPAQCVCCLQDGCRGISTDPSYRLLLCPPHRSATA